MADRPTFTSPDDLPAPSGYSHVVSIPAGRLVWTSGQVPIEPDGSLSEGWEAQTRTAFANVSRALRAARADWADVVKLTIYVVDVSELATIRTVRDEFFGQRGPAMPARGGWCRPRARSWCRSSTRTASTHRARPVSCS